MSATEALEGNPPGMVTTVVATYPSAPRAWWTVFVLTLLYALSLLDRQIIGLLVKDIRADLSVSDFQIGLLYGLTFAIFYVLFGLGFGWAADRYSRRILIFGGVIFWSLATAGCGLARNFTQLASARFAVGAGEAALNPAAYSLLSDSFPPQQRSLALSVFGTGSQLGTGLSYLLGGFLVAAMPTAGLMAPIIGHIAGWQAVFIAVGLPGILLVMLVWTIADPIRREFSSTAGSSYREAIRFMKDRRRFLAGHFVGYGMLAATANGFSAWAPSYMMRNFNAPVTEVVLVLAGLQMFVGASGTICAGLIVDRWFTRGTKDAHMRLFIGIAAAQALILILAATSPTLPLFVICAGAFIGLSAWTGAAAAAIQVTTPNQFRGQVSSAYLFMFNLFGLGIGPAFVGAIASFWFRNDAMLGWSIALAGIVLLPIAIFAFWSGLKPMRKAVEAASAWAPIQTAS